MYRDQPVAANTSNFPIKRKGIVILLKNVSHKAEGIDLWKQLSIIYRHNIRTGFNYEWAERSVTILFLKSGLNLDSLIQIFTHCGLSGFFGGVAARGGECTEGSGKVNAPSERHTYTFPWLQRTASAKRFAEGCEVKAGSTSG